MKKLVPGNIKSYLQNISSQKYEKLPTICNTLTKIIKKKERLFLYLLLLLYQGNKKGGRGHPAKSLPLFQSFGSRKRRKQHSFLQTLRTHDRLASEGLAPRVQPPAFKVSLRASRPTKYENKTLIINFK